MPHNSSAHHVVREDGLIKVVCHHCGRKTSFSTNAQPDELCCVYCEGLALEEPCDCG